MGCPLVRKLCVKGGWREHSSVSRSVRCGWERNFISLCFLHFCDHQQSVKFSGTRYDGPVSGLGLKTYRVSIKDIVKSLLEETTRNASFQCCQKTVKNQSRTKQKTSKAKLRRNKVTERKLCRKERLTAAGPVTSDNHWTSKEAD